MSDLNFVRTGRLPIFKYGKLFFIFSSGLQDPTGQCTVPAAAVAHAQKLPMADSERGCDLRRWQPDWVVLSDVHKRIAIIDLCRPSVAHQD